MENCSEHVDGAGGVVLHHFHFPLVLAWHTVHKSKHQYTGKRSYSTEERRGSNVPCRHSADRGTARDQQREPHARARRAAKDDEVPPGRGVALHRARPRARAKFPKPGPAAPAAVAASGRRLKTVRSMVGAGGSVGLDTFGANPVQHGSSR